MPEGDEVSEDEIKIARHRLEAMPSNLEISIGGKSFRKSDLKEHLEKEDEIGRTFAKMQIAGLRSFKEI